MAIPASGWGKLKMMAEVIAILALILGRDHLRGFFVLGQIALWIVIATALWSAFDYYRRFNAIVTSRARVADFAEARRRAEQKRASG
jgi:CDP-diacylglycerol--glycerol-3-phosphate 3-phosphatidyltransferase